MIIKFLGEAYDRHGFKIIPPEPVAAATPEEALDRFTERVEGLVKDTPFTIGYILITQEEETNHG